MIIMGCWNGTCGLTQLPIKHGEKIVLIPLFKQKQYEEDFMNNTFHYADDLFTPLTPSIRGTYDDYGSIENIKNIDTVNIIFEWFKETFKKEFQEKVDTGKFMEVNEINTLKDMFDIIERGYFTQMGFVMFHEKVFDAMVEEISNRIPYGKDYTFRTKNEQKLNLFIKFFNRKFKEVYLEGEAMEDDEASLSQKKQPVERELFEFKIERAFEEIFGKLPKKSYPLFYKVAEGNREFFKDIIDLYMMRCAMSFSRKMWIPQCGSGSQSAEYFLGKIIGKFMDEKESEVKKYIVEEGYCEEDCSQEEIDNITKEALYDFDRKYSFMEEFKD